MELPGTTKVTKLNQLGNIQELRLNNRNLTSMRTNDFTGLTRLLRLFLNNNLLTNLPAGIFDDTTGLRHLYLERN